MERMYCSVGFSEVHFHCSFLSEIVSKLTPKMTKISKVSIFQRFYAFFQTFERPCGLERW